MRLLFRVDWVAEMFEGVVCPKQDHLTVAAWPPLVEVRVGGCRQIPGAFAAPVCGHQLNICGDELPGFRLTPISFLRSSTRFFGRPVRFAASRMLAVRANSSSSAVRGA